MNYTCFKCLFPNIYTYWKNMGLFIDRLNRLILSDFQKVFRKMKTLLSINCVHIYTINVHCVLSCNIKKSKTPTKLSENNCNTRRRSNSFYWRLLWRQCLYCCRFLHESGTRNALLGPWPNNTEVYLTTFISTHNHTVVG